MIIQLLVAFLICSIDANDQLIESSTLDHNSEFEEVDFDKSVVIVWELVDLKSRSEISKIFESHSTHQNSLLVSYNPFMRSVILETYINNNRNATKEIIQPNHNLHTIFFIFDNQFNLKIFFGCPNSNTNKIHWKIPFFLMTNIRLFKNTYKFKSLDNAESNFRCQKFVQLLPGTVIHFTGKLNKNGTLIFSFVNSIKNQFYFFYYINDSFQLMFNDSKISHLKINEPIEDGFFLYYQEYEISVYANCPYNEKIIGFFWPEEFHQVNKMEIFINSETAIAKSDYLLNSYCAYKNLSKIINQNRKEFTNLGVIDTIENLVDSIKSLNSYANVFFPPDEKIDQLQEFQKNFPFSHLISPVQRVLIASRVGAQPSFFYRSIDDYAKGFSDGKFNFWIGLDFLNKITIDDDYSLRIELKNGQLLNEYNSFRVGNKSSNYVLMVSEPIFSENDVFPQKNQLVFSTYDYGSYSNKAISLNAGFWLSDRTEFCFSCENGFDRINNCTYTKLNNRNYYSNRLRNLNSEIYEIRMFLIPKHY